MKKLSYQELDQLFTDCKRKLLLINIPVAKDITLRINTRAKKRMGLCERNPLTNAYIVEASYFALVNKEQVENTLIHELLHTCEGCMNHGNLWKQYADKVKMYFNINIERTFSMSELEECGIIIPKAKYTVYCSECGNSWDKHKQSNITKHPENYKCSCGCNVYVKQNY